MLNIIVGLWNNRLSQSSCHCLHWARSSQLPDNYSSTGCILESSSCRRSSEYSWICPRGSCWTCS